MTSDEKQHLQHIVDKHAPRVSKVSDIVSFSKTLSPSIKGKYRTDLYVFLQNEKTSGRQLDYAAITVYVEALQSQIEKPYAALFART